MRDFKWFLLGLVTVLCLGALDYNNLRDIDGRLIAAQNLANGHETVHRFGFNDDLDTTTEQTIWDGGDGGFAGPDRPVIGTTALTINVSSDDANDAGLAITVEGLDENWDFQSVTGNLGAAAVTSGTVFTQIGDASGWMRINRAYNSSTTDYAGTVYIHNDGADTGTDGVPDVAGNIRAVILGDENQSLMAMYTIPDGRVAFLTEWCVGNLATGAAGNVTARLRMWDETGDLDRVQSKFGIGTGVVFCESIDPPTRYTARQVLEVTGVGSVNNMDASGTFSFYLMRE